MYTSTRAGALVPVRAVLDVTERAGVRCARAHVMDAVDPGIAPGDFRGLCDALPTGLAVMGGTRCLWANTALRVELGLTGADDDPVDALSWLPPAAHEEARSREASALCSTIGPDTTALLATNGRSVEVVCSAGVPVVFAGAPAALHTVEPADRARVRLGSGAAPAPSRNRYRTPR